MKKKLVLGLVLSLFFTIGLTNTLQAEEETFDEVNSEVYENGIFSRLEKVSDGYIVSGMMGLKTIVMKLDTDGKEVWRYQSDVTEGIQVIKVTSDGGVLISTDSSGLRKLNSSGQVEWKTDMESVLNGLTIYARTIEETSDGYLIATVKADGYGKYSAVISKISKDAQTLIWQKEIGTKDDWLERSITNINVLPNGKILLVGSLFAGTTNNDVVMLDGEGTIISSFTLSCDYVKDVDVVDGKVMIAGSTSTNAVLTLLDYDGTVINEKTGGLSYSNFKFINETDDSYQVLIERPYNYFSYVEISKNTLEEIRTVVIPRPEGSQQFRVWGFETLDNGNFIAVGLVNNDPFIKEYGFILSVPPVEPTQPIDPDKPGGSTIGGSDTQQGSSQGSKTQAPATGDSTNLMLYVGLAFISLTAIARYKRS
ncbi:outer membrane protein assembly factor BamB family protein [Breznakia pachnodae]|uniref:LPXTG-motif cell wall-anchored protein n=1 Tax=Breznakia pachnodae TaxID=265178 RepID=A0ABU0E033_9FIRM|nr:hypothetical protein [Breznakia pachnodae]MDQ0360247.1 LPXTG-motif cell wall-anchored protein [Breznakia pachnodae]